MFETLKRLWAAGRLTEAMLDNAISKGWITEAQKTEIVAQ